MNWRTCYFSMAKPPLAFVSLASVAATFSQESLKAVQSLPPRTPQFLD
jgi:hypothetical protein